MSDRAHVVAAIQSSANLNQAARKLHASRKTLYNRMREYHLPHGHDGRPRKELVGGSSENVLVLLALVGIGGLAFFASRAAWNFARNRAQEPQAQNTYLHGLHVQIAGK